MCAATGSRIRCQRSACGLKGAGGAAGVSIGCGPVYMAVVLSRDSACSFHRAPTCYIVHITLVTSHARAVQSLPFPACTREFPNMPIDMSTCTTHIARHFHAPRLRCMHTPQRRVSPAPTLARTSTVRRAAPRSTTVGGAAPGTCVGPSTASHVPREMMRQGTRREAVPARPTSAQ